MEMEIEVLFALQAVEPTEDQPVPKVKGRLVEELHFNEKVLPHEISREKYPQLAEIRIPEVELKKVSLIIEEDVRKVHVVQEVRVSFDVDCYPYPTKTTTSTWMDYSSIYGKEGRRVETN